MNSVDLFAGAGGWSHGWREATGCEPVVAVNHCAHAVRLHTLNHPSTRHFLEDVRAVDPRAAAAGRRVAQGFPDNYILEGSKRDQTARIGNSVVPQVAAALVRANLGREAIG